ncbi:MAG: hypothetical protein M3515_07630 [Actinomycetota bacterium]|jgi:hypothetical protein|nr:hypothetical protein [Thermoleophilaceae bacterium]MDQ3240187.1 hypothetical protein [Actinomycetota bacterium]MDQ3320088.1 hypothetical protein [Actinomycetota bacterium]MDQ3356562.1 hypothetical protein [Actinomycetota bacterium]
MAISMLQEMPNNTLENYDAVSSKVGIESDPPEGLIFHTAAEMEGGGVRIFNVWESRDAFERFQDERLLPAIRERFGGELPPPPEQKITEVHHLVAPSR